MIDLGLASEYGRQNPHIFSEAFGDTSFEPTLVQAAKLAIQYTDRVLPYYANSYDPVKKAGNCADRAALDFALLSAFPHLYPTMAVFENQEYGSIHFYNAVLDIDTRDVVIVDNSFRRDKLGEQRKGTQQLISAAWAPVKNDLDIYAPIYKATMGGALELYDDPNKTEIILELGHLIVPIDSDNLSLGFKDKHIPSEILPEEDEAQQQAVSILRPTIITMFNNDESCGAADQILMNES
jgi:hypothetical protein